MAKKQNNTNPSRERTDTTNKIVTTIISTLFLSMLVIIIGWYLGASIVKNLDDKYFKNNTIEDPKPLADKITDSAMINSLTGTVVSLPVILTNLKSSLSDYKEDGVWLRTEIDLILNKEKAIDPVVKSKISDDFLNYFKETNVTALRGPTGLMHIKEDLLDRANIITDNAVKFVFIKTLVVQ